jgi:hypothetical protein
VDKIVVLLGLWFFSLPVFGQQIIPHGEFHKDSVKIGEELPYSLWVRYPKDKDVVFPDSLYDFSPFEHDRRVYFTTRTDSIESLDSAVFYFSTFDIDTVQYLTLPVFIINEFDSTILYTNTDSIVLDQVVVTLPDSAAVLVDTRYHKVPLTFNYPYFTAAVVIILLVALAIFLVFGKRIRKSIRIYWLNRRHKKFLNSFKRMIEAEPIEVEKSLSMWKIYLEKLLSEPISKFTTKEIVSRFTHSSLAEQLNIIDRYIYGGDLKSDTKDAFNALSRFSIEQFNVKLKEIKNG